MEYANIALQINGKVYDTLSLPYDMSDEILEEIIREDNLVKNVLDGKLIQKIVIVPNKLISVISY